MTQPRHKDDKSLPPTCMCGSDWETHFKHHLFVDEAIGTLRVIRGSVIKTFVAIVVVATVSVFGLGLAVKFWHWGGK